MATIDSKNLLVWVKAMSRGQALPLDASEIHDSLAAAETYAGTATAYEGQTIKAKLEDGKYHEYILQPSEAGYVLEEVGAVKASDLKQFVMVVENLPTSGQEEGILYICGTTGSIWTGSAWKTVFYDLTDTIEGVGDRVKAVEDELPNLAPISNPVFSGVVKVGEEEVALKSYVEGLFAALEERCATPGIVDSENPIPDNYKAGDSFRVAESGTYAGVECEAGDLILVIKDYAEGTASNADFMVLQANIDGAVTSTSDATTVGEIVVFDSVTGKIIKGAGVQIASLNDAIAKAHEHSNKTQLDTYNKTQSELLAAAQETAQGLVNAHADAVNKALDDKADKETTLAGYGITDAYTSTQVDNLLSPIQENLNTKVTGAQVDTKITERVGEIPTDKTVKDYIDSVVESGGVDTAGAIAEAKAEAIKEAKDYADANICATIVVPYSVTVPAEGDDPRVVAMQAVKAAIDEGKKFDVRIGVSSSEHVASYHLTSRNLSVFAVDHSTTWSVAGKPVTYTITLDLSNNTVSVSSDALYTEDIGAATTGTQRMSAPSTTAVQGYVTNSISSKVGDIPEGNTVKQYVETYTQGLLQVVEF